MTLPTEPTVSRCKECGAPLSANARGGLCLRCALNHALEASASGDTAVAASDELAPRPPSLSPRAVRYFGDYELLEEIGRGGMGVVYKARQVSLNRFVAVKMLLSGELASKEFVQRFRTEASAAALLQHPNIVAIHEVGVHDGQHYFSMDYVEGPSLGKLVVHQPLPARRAAGYVKTIAEAIHYAHERGILHRDLKPSNVLIDPFDQPRVTDFGLAKRLGVPPSGGAGASEPAAAGTPSDLTISGQVLGSPNYMPPEQAAAKRGKVGKPSDVYSLGAILYHLITGRPPFVGESLTDTLHQVLNAEPVSPRLLIPSVPRDLETICLKCLEKEPEKRYATAQALADELGRFLIDEPIQARPVSTPEKFWRWCRRKPVVASLSAATLLLLLAVAIGAPIAALRIAHGRKELEETLYFNRVALAYREVEANKPAHALKLLDACPQKLRDWEWNYVRKRCYQPAQHIAQTSGRVRSLAVSPNGRDVAVVAGEELQLWEFTATGALKTNAVLGPTPFTSLEAVSWVAFSPDGVFLAAVGTSDTVNLWDVARRTVRQTFTGHSNLITSVAFHPDGRQIATGALDNTVRIWDVANGREINKLENGNWVSCLAYSPNGQWLAAGTYIPNVVRGWDAHTGKDRFELTGHLAPLSCMAISPDSQWLASACTDHTLILWEMSTRKGTPLVGHRGQVNTAAFSPGGTRLVTASLDREVKVWDLKTKREVLSLSGHTDNVSAIAFTPDGRQLLSGGFDRTLRVWDVSPVTVRKEDEPETLTAHTNRIWSLDFMPDGRLVSAGEDFVGRVWDVAQKKELGRFESIFDVAASQDGRYIVSAEIVAASHGSFSVAILDAVSLKKKFSTPPRDREMLCAALSPSGDYLVAGAVESRADSIETEVTVWNWRVSDRSWVLGKHKTAIWDVQFSPDGRHLGSLSEDGMVKLWNATRLSERQEGQVLLPATALREFGQFRFSHDSKRLACGDASDGVVVLDVEKGTTVLNIPHAHGGIVTSVAFSPDGRFLASGGTDNVVHVWDAKTGKHFKTCVGHTGVVNAVAFSPDGRLLASGGHDHTIKLWRLDAGLLIDGTPMTVEP